MSELKQQRETADHDLKEAKSRFESAEIELKAAKQASPYNQVAVAECKVAVAECKVAVAKAEVAVAKAELHENPNDESAITKLRQLEKTWENANTGVTVAQSMLAALVHPQPSAQGTRCVIGLPVCPAALPSCGLFVLSFGPFWSSCCCVVCGFVGLWGPSPSHSSRLHLYSPMFLLHRSLHFNVFLVVFVVMIAVEVELRMTQLQLRVAEEKAVAENAQRQVAEAQRQVAEEKARAEQALREREQAFRALESRGMIACLCAEDDVLSP